MATRHGWPRRLAKPARPADTHSRGQGHSLLFGYGRTGRSGEGKMAANVSDLLGLRMDELMRVTIERGASDLHLAVGIPPTLRIDGRLAPTEFPKLSPEDTKRLVYSILTDAQKER